MTTAVESDKTTRVKFSVWIAPELRRRINAAASLDGVTNNDFIAEVLEKYLNERGIPLR